MPDPAEKPPEPAPQVLTESQRRALVVFDDLWNDGARGAELRAKVKEKFPDAVLPEDNLRPILEPIQAENKSLKERLEAIETERQAEKAAAAQKQADADFEGRINAARSKFNLNGDGFDKMIARMKETQNFTDAEAAAAWVAAQQPAPAPRQGAAFSPGAADFYGTKVKDEQFEKLHTNPEAYEDEQLRQFLADPEGFTQETLGYH